MPRATLLPTPASSADIKGQDGSKMASLQLAFELPPPAVAGEGSPNLSTTTTATLYPTQASETVKSRRRSSAANPPKDQFALPPPPTRSRKIIQMKPREESNAETASSSSKSASKSGAGAASSATPAVAGTKRKQPSATSAAGRKIARKTAHSLIERRRRSKMNEEFAVLKGLIPACTGEMHKLAILQASIEYVRYLEECIAKLKAQCGSDANANAKPGAEPRSTLSGLPSPALLGESYHHNNGNNTNNASRSYAPTAHSSSSSSSVDTEMTGSSPSVVASPAFTPTMAGARSQQPSVSPALVPEDARNRHNSYSSVSSEYRLHGYSSAASATTSPFFGPQHSHAHSHSHSLSHSAFGSALTSPALPPQRDIDQEATAALLMLNQMDRRASASTIAPRGMSVRDLLSS